jgi:hypothetical protein
VFDWKTDLDNDDWLLDVADLAIRAKIANGVNSLGPLHRLIYCLWCADYGMRNAGDLSAAAGLYEHFHADARRAAGELNLPRTLHAFSLTIPELESQYFDLFGGICDELRSV